MALARFVPCSVYVTVNHESIRRVAWSSSLTGGNRLLVRSLMQVAKKSVIPKMASLRALLPSVRCSGRVVQCTTRRARIQQQQRRLATEAVQNVARRSGVSVPTVLVGTTLVGGGAVAGISWYLGVSLLDWEYFLGIKKEEPVVAMPDILTRMPELPKPAEYVHPYANNSWWWKVRFIIRRGLFLVYLMVPLFKISFRVFWNPSCQELREMWCQEIVTFLNRAGCSFQKFGQWLSMRPDIFPPMLITALSQLRQEVPAHSYAHTAEVVEESLGKKITDIFDSFDPVPVASGSVAQVHRATLKPEYALADGSVDVAVKVRHPDVLKETFVDLNLIFDSVPVINFLLNMTKGGSAADGQIAFPFNEESIFTNMQKQLDFQWEAYNLIKFHQNFVREMQGDTTGYGRLNFPVVSTELLSDAVLVESWAPGVTVSDIYENLSTQSKEVSVQSKIFGLRESIKQKSDHVRRRLARSVFDLVAKMFLRDNFIHGDLHAGNLLFDADNGVLTVMDAGLVTTLPNEVFNEFGDFMRAMCTRDAITMAEKLIFFHDQDARNAQPRDTINKDKLQADLEDIYINGKGRAREGVPLSRAMGDIMGEIVTRVGRHGLVLRSEVASCIMSISVSEGLIFQLDPDLDILNFSVPYFVRYRSWTSAEQLMDYGYVTSERKSKDLVKGLASRVGLSAEEREEAAASIAAPDKQPSSRST